MLKRRDWQPTSLKQHLRRCWTRSEIFWAIMTAPSMRRMGETRMMMENILRGASFVKMTNPAGCWAQSQKRYSIAWCVFSRCRWSLINSCTQAGETRPTPSMRGMRSTEWLNWRFQLSFNLKRQIMQRHLCQRHLVSLWRVMIASPEYCKCHQWLLDQGVVVCGLVCGNCNDTKTFRHSQPPRCPIGYTFIINSCWTRKLQPLHIASHVNYQSGNRIPTKTWLMLVPRRRNQYADWHSWWCINLKCNIWTYFAACPLYYISVTKLWDIIIRLCMYKGRIGHANGLDFKCDWLTTNEHDIVLPVTVKLDNWNSITDETHKQNISQWCHTSHRGCGQSTMLG